MARVDRALGLFLAVTRLIARLRDFLGHKGDEEPDAKTIWVGLQPIMDVAAGSKFPRGAWVMRCV